MLPDDVTGAELPKEVRADLRSLSAVNAETVSRHLVMAGRLLEEDPELAYAHASTAQRLAGRVGAVREAFGIAAYAAGHFAEALAELRAARRITGANDYLPMMADCERGLGRPERALALAGSPEAAALDKAGSVEMRIVAAGARRDLGQADAAVLTLQGPDLTSAAPKPWTARLRYAYADALLGADRAEEALTWFRRALDSDTDGETDAAERIAELEGLEFLDLEDDEETEELSAQWSADLPPARAPERSASPAVQATAAEPVSGAEVETAELEPVGAASVAEAESTEEPASEAASTEEPAAEAASTEEAAATAVAEEAVVPEEAVVAAQPQEDESADAETVAASDAGDSEAGDGEPAVEDESTEEGSAGDEVTAEPQGDEAVDADVVSDVVEGDEADASGSGTPFSFAATQASPPVVAGAAPAPLFSDADAVESAGAPGATRPEGKPGEDSDTLF